MDYYDTRQVAAHVETYSYKPGFTFMVWEHPYEGTCLEITFFVPNSYRQGEQQTQCVNVPVPPLVSPTHVYDWLEWRLTRIEMHELCEFSRVSGQPRNDPHSPEYWELGKPK
jgi:hypothetical protein